MLIVKKAFIEGVFERLIERSIPSQKTIQLNRKNIFVFPTHYGFLYVLVSLVVWLLGTNYQNNLVLFIAYFMFALCVIVIHHTFNNIAQLRLSFSQAEPVFAGETACFVFQVKNTQLKKRHSFFGLFKHQQLDTAGYISAINVGESAELSVHLPALKRGKLIPKRLGFYTFYPLGLVRCWTWLDLNPYCLVYPKPIKMPLVAQDSLGEGRQNQRIKNTDELDHFKRYTPGDELKHIAWKASAKGKGLMTKHYLASSHPEVCLSLDAIAATSLELKLSGLCYWATHFYQNQQPFSAVINGHIFSLKESKAQPLVHYRKVLACLATYNLPTQNIAG